MKLFFVTLSSMILLPVLTAEDLNKNTNDRVWHSTKFTDSRKSIEIQPVSCNYTDAGNISIILERTKHSPPRHYLIILIKEAAHLKAFPLEHYEGPSDKSKRDPITITAFGPPSQASIQILPNAYYISNPPDAFVFTLTDPRLLKMLSHSSARQTYALTIRNPKGPALLIHFTNDGLRSALSALNP